MADVMTEEPTPKAYAKKKFIFRAYQLIWFVLGIIEVLLAFRVVLLALGANPQAGFANFIYAVSDPDANHAHANAILAVHWNTFFLRHRTFGRDPSQP